VIAIAVALLPVLAFLAILMLCDSFKLVHAGMLIRALVAGAAAALAAALLHALVFDVTTLDARQIGFLVDAAIVGFAIGAGFAVVENIEYLSAVTDARPWLWIARGFGTAILHATTTAVMAMAAKSLFDRAPQQGWPVYLPGLAAAVALHSLFNHALVSPVLAAAMLMLLLPLVVLAVFSRSERKTREWVGDGLDLDVELLALIKSSGFASTRMGRYLEELKSRFPGPVVADMFCLLQVDLELSIRAKGFLMAREAGLELPPDPAVDAQLAERAYLEKAIGRTGLLALRPLQMTSDRDLWHQYVLERAGRRSSWWRRIAGFRTGRARASAPP